MKDAVGIAVVETPPADVDHVASPARHCTFVGQARQGKTIWASSDDINCPIARYILGCDATAATRDPALASFLESKLMSDLDAAGRFLDGFRALEPRPRVFVYFPLDAAPVTPDVVVRFLRPDDAMRELRAFVTATGERADVRTAGSAAMCGDCTAGVLVSGRPTFSPGCPGSRREVPIASEEVLVACSGRTTAARGAAAGQPA